MRVLITGATGFIGSYVTRALLERGWTVAVVVRPGSDTWRIDDLLPRLDVVSADLVAGPPDPAALAAFAPALTIHLAWHGVAGSARNDSRQVDNLHAGVRLLDAARAAGCRRFIGLGSHAEYGPADRRLDEASPPAPVTMYGIAKLATARLTGRLCQLHDVDFVWLRLFVSYGPADAVHWLIPYVILSLLRGERPSLTAGRQRLDYLFIDDLTDAVVRLAEQPDVHGIFNLASGESPTVRGVAESIRDLIDPGLPLGFGEIPYGAEPVPDLSADTAKLRRAIGWEPRTPLAEGLRRTIEWYRKDIGART